MLQIKVSMRNLRLMGKVEVSKIDMGFKGPSNYEELGTEEGTKT